MYRFISLFMLITILCSAGLSFAQSPEAQVAGNRDGLRLRQSPDQNGAVLDILRAGDALVILGKTADNLWLLVQTSTGLSGWVWAEYVDIFRDLNSVPVSDGSAPVPQTDPAAVAATPEVPQIPPLAYEYAGMINMTGRAREIYLNGQALGNRANVFSKVGDSLTISSYFLFPIGRRRYDLRDFAYLQPVIQHFSSRRARDNNSFANAPLAADDGWTSADVLNPLKAKRGCRRNEIPLLCEYRLTRPAVALILIGTNDVAQLSSEAFAGNLAQIVQLSIDKGVIPILSTLPWRFGFEAQVPDFNRIIRETAQVYDVPLWDYGTAMDRLPNHGISGDGAHPSFAPGSIEHVDFAYENLSYGYAVRNLMALIVLEAVWRQVMY